MIQAAEYQVVPVRGAKLWPMSVEAYHLLGESGVIAENTELLYGLVYTKMPKSPFHSFLLQRFLQILQKLELPGLLLRAKQPLTFVDSEPEADKYRDVRARWNTAKPCDPKHLHRSDRLISEVTICV